MDIIRNNEVNNMEDKFINDGIENFITKESFKRYEMEDIEMCKYIDPMIEDECDAVLNYSDILKIIDDKYKKYILEILNDESKHYLLLSKIRDELDCSELGLSTLSILSDIKKFDILNMKYLPLEEIIALYRLGYRA
jgi:rubrerythrin